MFSRIFVKGLAFLVPVVGTVAIVMWIASGIEKLLVGAFGSTLPQSVYFPGFGLLAGVLIIFVVGLLVHLWIFRKLADGIEKLFARAPLVKAIYGSLKDFSDFVFPSDASDRKLGRSVRVNLGETGSSAVGFEMVSDLSQHAFGKGDDRASDKVAVYLPMSYQLGGYMIIVDRENVEPLDLKTEETLRLTLTAGVGGNEKA